MRTFSRSTLLACLIATPAFAQEPSSVQPEPPAVEQPGRAEQRRLTAMDKLFDQLKREPNPAKAERLAGRIGAEFAKSGSASIDLMLGWATEAMQAKKFDVALDFLDQVIIREPRFAEGYNRRATVHFMMQNYALSMADIERTIEIEPRHFGALSGMAQIMRQTGRDALALRAYERVLAVYPMSRDAQTAVGELADTLAGERA